MIMPDRLFGFTAWSMWMDEDRVSGTTGRREGDGEEWSKSDNINKDELGRESCMCREQRNAYRELGDKYEGKSPHGRPRHRWLNEKKQDLKKKRMAWNVFIWLTTETNSINLCTRQSTFKLHRILGIS
jgi:hypothetical protein